ncbi:MULTISPECIES: hypothetical protein [Bacillaceae]|uniref:Uncharacterized protein n=1 Tax=Evansella alkalicola TaxID=745819 RepID=A0ABS6K0I3_9BACI|nr:MULTISPECIES: hypothetical protein [Bacillaceae]MBU9724371.1 hypothetical protein [Bacillus alkalicola]
MSVLLYFLVYILPISLSTAIGYYSSDNRQEELIIPKLIGFYFLGTLIFWYGIIPLPFGFGVGYGLIHYWSKEKKFVNAPGKKRVLIAGLIVSFISHILF